ncbi:beta-ketoacyl-ACP synthase II [bacterium]|nr:beta-ketoacyl-ACP synthase II [bacterium]
MKDSERIVVTGLGAVAPTGYGVKENWDSVINGRSGIGPITLFDSTDNKVHIAGECHYDPTPGGFSERDAARYDRSVLHAVNAGLEAVRDSDIDFANRGDNHDVCIIMGSGIGGIDNIQKTCGVMFEKGPGRVTPFLVPSGTADVGAHTIAMRLGIHGFTCGVATACASGNDAISTAFLRLRGGFEQVAICGGSEAPVCKLSIATFANMKALSSWDGDGDPKRVSRPFDRNRSGFVISEGAGVIVLETLEHAKKRGARIYCELGGVGQSTDAYHVTAPEPTGSFVSLAMRQALERAEIDPNTVDYINAHGTSTHHNDVMETNAIKTVFGEHARELCVSSTKSMTGHCVAGCGGIEAVFCVKAIETGIVPPTINYEEPDPECDLDYVPNKARELKVRAALSDTFGFGGHNAVLCFKRFE